MLNKYLPLEVSGQPDAINWKTLRLSANLERAPKLTAPEQALGRVASIRAADATPFPRFLPDLAVMLLGGKDGRATLYSLVHNREHTNISWILGESETAEDGLGTQDFAERRSIQSFGHDPRARTPPFRAGWTPSKASADVFGGLSKCALCAAVSVKALRQSSCESAGV